MIIRLREVDMTSVLIIMATLGMGGAEKSLITFLNSINENYLKEKRISIDILTAEEESPLAKQIPNFINILECPLDFKIYALQRKQALIYIKNKAKVNIWKTWYDLRCRLCRKKISQNEKYWEANKRYIKEYEKEYDVCFAYMNGTTTYYAIDKVKAKEKIIWVHNDYKKLNYTDSFQRRFFLSAQSVVTISDICVKSIIETFPETKGKVYKIENIFPATLVRKQADEFYPSEYLSIKKVKLISIGRLNVQKGFDIGIQTIKILKERGYDVVWFILGEGELRNELENTIKKNDLSNNIRLIGIRSNPYPYLKNADIFFQPSRYEGKSITLDEAKILCKPIVVSNYPTVGDSIINGVNGTVVDLEPNKMANAIRELIEDEAQRTHYIKYLREHENGNSQEIVKYYELMQG